MEIEYCVGLACGWKYSSKDRTSEGECLKSLTVNPPTLVIGTILHLREIYRRGPNSSWVLESRTPLIAHYMLDLTCSLNRCNSPTMGQLIHETVWEHYSVWQNFSYYLKKSLPLATDTPTSTTSVMVMLSTTTTTTTTITTTSTSSTTTTASTSLLDLIDVTMIKRRNTAHTILPSINLIIFFIFVTLS